ncbi:LysR family transcriptional regulator [Azospirillum griseum]|uniref:LysR family transcriptional regulator n=1 Tax=Azospirillum griseum TaxID=2496639 RepID=A0A431VF53_9PROT|nr:LysR family transcriptional regulator [Azospirillum griseum]RTR18310.1 LysR family transcriptional regulator [Azospirillum griseum]
MALPDLNLLVTLDVLLAEGSVARAARRLNLSPSAMSRALARLREVTGDPLLVRAGRDLVPTPRALELRARVHQLVEDGAAVLRPVETLTPQRLARTFTLRSSEGFVETVGPELIAAVTAAAPGVRLVFLPKPDKDSAPLRDGAVDLETGVVTPAMGPELRAQALFRDRFVAVVRPGHPLAAGMDKGPLTLDGYSAAAHVCVTRSSAGGGKGGLGRGPVDSALRALGLERRIIASVGGFAAALAVARRSDLVATVPLRHTAALRAGLCTRPLPFATPEVTISLLWHPRQDADPAHRWLRALVRDACAAALGGLEIPDGDTAP